MSSRKIMEDKNVVDLDLQKKIEQDKKEKSEKKRGIGYTRKNKKTSKVKRLIAKKSRKINRRK